MAETPEGRVKKLCNKWFDSHSIPRWAVIPSPMGRSTGMSDIVGILKTGQWLAIECKRPGAKNKVTVHQQKFLDTINANKGYGFVVDSQADLDNIEILLKTEGVL